MYKRLNQRAFSLAVRVAIPLWNSSLLKGTHQQLAVLINTAAHELITYQQSFGVLDLRSFDKDMIHGYDSPIHQTEGVKFDLTQATIASKRKVE